MDYSSPGSCVHGILQARILAWVVLPSSRGSPNPGVKPASSVAPALQADSLLLRHWRSPSYMQLGDRQTSGIGKANDFSCKPPNISEHFESFCYVPKCQVPNGLALGWRSERKVERGWDGESGLRKTQVLSWMHCLTGNGFGKITDSGAVSSTVKWKGWSVSLGPCSLWCSVTCCRGNNTNIEVGLKPHLPLGTTFSLWLLRLLDLPQLWESLEERTQR